MLVADAMGDTKTRVEVPRELTCYKLNSDGTYEMCNDMRCSIYIDERQMSKIWDPVVSKFIREKYGPLVGVMHFLTNDIHVPIYPTYKYVLGG